jgi:hypothetical protein
VPTRPTGTLEHTNWTAYTHARGAHHILGLVLDTFSTLLSQSWWERFRVYSSFYSFRRGETCAAYNFSFITFI